MLHRVLQKLGIFLRVADNRSARRARKRSSPLVLECLESRDVPAPLTWAAGANLPLAEAGIVAQREGANLLTMAGPATTSYTLSAAYPSWQASTASTVQSLDFARSSPGVGTLPNGYFLVYGGMQNGFATSAVTQYDPNTVTVVDGVTNQTKSLHSMLVPRAEFGSATDANQLSYAIGGEDNNGTPLASVEVYNSTANSWTYLASLPQTLYGESAVSDGAGHIYTFGGVGANGAITNIVYRYTIASNSWDQLAAPMPVGTRDSASVLAPNGLIYVIGGQVASGATATVESYNIATNTWNLETSLPQAISSAAASVDSLGRITVLGGNDANGNPLATTYVSQEFTQADLAPTITSAAPAAGVLNSGYAYQVTSTGSPQPAYSLTTYPPGMTINSTTGLISWTPTAVGTYNATVQASNGVGAVATQSFTINVILPTPAAPTGVTGTPLSATTVGLSWNASTDPYFASYDVYRQYAHVYHSPRGSGGGVTYTYSLVASGLTATSVVLAGSGPYVVTAVNTAGYQSPHSALVNVSVATLPILYTATTTSGADISSLSLNVGQTGQINLIQESGNPAPTFAVVSSTEPPSGGVSVNATTGQVVYTPTAADIGTWAVQFTATTLAGTSAPYTFYYSVNALNPTVTVGGDIAYDGNSHDAPATALAADGSPVAGSFTFIYNGDPTLPPPTAAGTYTVTATFTSANPAYANAVATGSFTIDPATPSISISDGPFNYDGTTQWAATATATFGGVDLVAQGSGSFQFTYTDSMNNSSAAAPTGPGLYTVTAAFISTDPNFASATATSSMIINSAGTLTPNLVLADGSATYDGQPHADTATEADGVAGSFFYVYTNTATNVSSTSAPTQAGDYDVAATFISADPNYANGTISGMMTISAAAPTITIASSPFVYDGNGHAAAVAALGVDQATQVNGTFSLTYTDSNGVPTTPVNAGVYNVIVNFTSNDSNYLSTSATGALTILPAPANVTILNSAYLGYGLAYTGQPQGISAVATNINGAPLSGAFDYSYSEVNQYSYNPTVTPLSGAPVDASGYNYYVYYVGTATFTSLDPNYTTGTSSVDYIILPASEAVNINGGPFTYNGGSQGATVSVVGVDGVTPVSGAATIYYLYSGAYSTNAPSLPGSYTVLAEFSSYDPNYSTSSAVYGTEVITKATPSFSGVSSPVVNIGTNTVTLSGHIAAGSATPGGDDLAITLNGVTQPVAITSSGSFSATFNIAGLATGTYPIVYSFLGDGSRFNAASAGSGTLTVQAAPSILTSPVSQTIVSGNSVTFSASASGYPAPTVQWQQSTNGATYTNIAGATNPTYTFAVAAGQNGYRYRAVFSNSVGSATTPVATLTVQFAPSVTTNPINQTVNAGGTTTFTAAAAGNPAPTVQWQVSTDGGKTFSPIVGANGTTLTLAGTSAGQNGYIYNAVFTNSVGSATTANATLNVKFAPTVMSSPASQTVNAGQSATFTASAGGNPTPTVQWQVSSNGGASWSNISGATSATYAITSATASQNGYLYRAVFNNSVGSATTNAATLAVQFLPAIKTNPTNQSANAGRNVSFTASATGNPAPTPQWQVSTNSGVSWSNIPGATSTTLALSGVTASQNGNQYRAVFSNSLGAAATSAATLTVQYAPIVTTNPLAQSVKHGSSVSFTAAAIGNPAPSVLWYVSTDGGVTFNALVNNSVYSGVTSKTLVISSATVAMNNYEYRAVFTDSLGTATTSEATLSVI